jgi:hypothetical protein
MGAPQYKKVTLQGSKTADDEVNGCAVSPTEILECPRRKCVPVLGLPRDRVNSRVLLAAVQPCNWRSSSVTIARRLKNKLIRFHLRVSDSKVILPHSEGTNSRSHSFGNGHLESEKYVR